MSHKIIGFSRTNYKYLNFRTKLFELKRNETPKIFKRSSAYYIPPTQYDTPLPIKFMPTRALRVYWELIPLFTITAFAIAIVFFHIFWAFSNKVDCVYSSHSRDNISRRMDLNHPTVHKMVLINQRYEAWPQMQNILDKMKAAEDKMLRPNAMVPVCKKA